MSSEHRHGSSVFLEQILENFRHVLYVDIRKILLQKAVKTAIRQNITNGKFLICKKCEFGII